MSGVNLFQDPTWALDVGCWMFITSTHGDEPSPPAIISLGSRFVPIKIRPVTVLEGIQKSTEFLAKKGVDSPRLNAELLLAHVLKMPRMQLYLSFDRALAAA